MTSIDTENEKNLWFERERDQMNAIFNLESNVNCIVEENYTNFEETIRNSSPWNTQMNHQMVMYLVASLKKVGLVIGLVVHTKRIRMHFYLVLLINTIRI